MVPRSAPGSPGTMPIRSLADIRGQRVTIMGLGTKGGGVETAKFFARHRAEVTVTDLKSEKDLDASVRELKDLPVKFVLGVHRDEDFLDADIVVPNPAVPLASPYIERARAAGAAIVSDIALFFALCPAPIAGITGTRGKTTTTTIAGTILRREHPETVIAGNVQRSPLADLERIRKKTPVVLELSSWQLEGMLPYKQSPHWAVYTTLLQDHLNRYASFTEYAKAKEIIFRFQAKEDIRILPTDDERVASYAKRVQDRVMWFGPRENASQAFSASMDEKHVAGVFHDGEEVVLFLDGVRTVIMPWAELGGTGDHTKRNMLGGAALAISMGASLDAVREILHTFTGVPHRLETVRVIDGRTFINDTTATTPEAVVAGLKAYPDHRIVLITGGTDKALDFQVLADALNDPRVAHVIFLDGSGTQKLHVLLKTSRFASAPVVRTMEDAVHIAASVALPGDVVLMSPGAASFELFRDEFDRGEQFRAAVGSLSSARSLS